MLAVAHQCPGEGAEAGDVDEETGRGQVAVVGTGDVLVEDEGGDESMHDCCPLPALIFQILLCSAVPAGAETMVRCFRYGRLIRRYLLCSNNLLTPHPIHRPGG